MPLRVDNPDVRRGSLEVNRTADKYLEEEVLKTDKIDTWLHGNVTMQMRGERARLHLLINMTEMIPLARHSISLVYASTPSPVVYK